MKPEDVREYENLRSELSELKDQREKLQEKRESLYKRKVEELNFEPLTEFTKYFSENYSDFDIEKKDGGVTASYSSSFYSLQKQHDRRFRFVEYVGKQNFYEFTISVKRKAIQTRERVVNKHGSTKPQIKRVKSEIQTVKDKIERIEEDIEKLENDQLFYSTKSTRKMNLDETYFSNLSDFLDAYFAQS